MRVNLDPFGVRIDAGPSARDLRELPVPELRDLVRERGLVLLRGFSPLGDADELSGWCARWGEVQPWPSGTVLDAEEAPHHGSVPLHWDGLFQRHIPEFQIFDCRGAGGRTVFVDTALLVAGADPALVAGWRATRVTYRVPRGSALAVVPVVSDVRSRPIVRFHEPGEDHLAPDHQFDGIAEDDVPAFLAEMREHLGDPRYRYTHSWQQGDVLIADNHTLLHGREAGAAHRLRRVHVLGSPAQENPYLATQQVHQPA